MNNFTEIKHFNQQIICHQQVHWQRQYYRRVHYAFIDTMAEIVVDKAESKFTTWLKMSELINFELEIVVNTFVIVNIGYSKL